MGHCRLGHQTSSERTLEHEPIEYVDRAPRWLTSSLSNGRVIGTHVGQVLHFAPTFRRVELHYAAFYRFDGSGKLVSERIVMNWAPLAGA